VNLANNPLISIIIPTRDRPEVLRQCIEHILSQGYRPYEIIVVDNSTDEVTHKVLAEFPDVIQIRETRTNSNPAHLRNLGLGQSKGEILAFIDDDTLVQPGWLTNLVRAYEDPTVGGASGRVLQDDAPPVDSRDVGIFNPRRGQIYNFNCTLTETFELDFLAGCNASFRRTALERVGGYDPAYGIICEEQDLSFRVRQAGYRLIFQEGMDVYHAIAPRPCQVVQRTKGSQDFNTRLANCRSLTYFWLKYFGVDWHYLWNSLLYWPLGDLKRCMLARSKNLFLHAMATHFGGWLGIVLWIRWYACRRRNWSLLAALVRK